MRRLALSLLAALLATSCQPRILSVQTEYLSHINLASFHVGTPDPRLRNPPLGQKLIISWDLREWDCNTNYELTVKIRFKNGTSFQQVLTVNFPKGTYVIPLLNEDYFEKGGLKTYMASMSGNGLVLEEWRHQLWVNLIEMPGNEEEEEESALKPETDQQIYDEHYKGEGAIQRPIDDITDPDQAPFKYYF